MDTFKYLKIYLSLHLPAKLREEKSSRKLFRAQRNENNS